MARPWPEDVVDEAIREENKFLLPEEREDVVLMILRATNERNDVEKLFELVAFESAREGELADAVLEERPRERVGDFLRLAEHRDVAPREISIAHLQRDAGRLLPHRAECGAEVFYGLDVLGVVSGIELMRADGLI